MLRVISAVPRYIEAVQSHQSAYTANLVQMVQYCPSGQFWTLRQQQQTSFALPMSPIINQQYKAPGSHRNSRDADDYLKTVGSIAEEPELEGTS